MTQDRAGATRRGFASMDINKQREIARKSGANVPHEKRSFAQDRALASDAGRKVGPPLRRMRAVFLPIAISHPKPVAKAVRQRNALVVGACGKANRALPNWPGQIEV